MVVAVVVLFAHLLFIHSLHFHAKWFWRNQGAHATKTQATMEFPAR
jgi:hypothetical protein